MSPRAAWRLERMGFERVYDYAPGKTDWTGAGLATEGRSAQMLRPHHLMDTDVPACAPEADAGEVARRADVRRAGYCLVLLDDGVVLGRLRGEALEEPEEGATAEQVMDPGPTSVRADSPLPDLVERLRKADVDDILVTAADGKLLGVLRRTVAEAALEELRVAHADHHD